MGTQSAGGGDGQSGNASVGVGAGNDRQGGAQEEDGSQRASGGSGGAQMTRSLEDTHSDAPSLHDERTACDEVPEAGGSAVTATTRGAKDTHSHQAGKTSTGLGVPETGGNQDPGDMAPPSNT